MTLLLSEHEVENLVEMGDAVRALEAAFKQQSRGAVSNSPRTRSRGKDSVLSAMHANLSFLGRAGLKCYVSSKDGTRFLFLLFDVTTSEPLAVIGADVLGRYRTGAASGLATQYLYGRKSARLAVLGTGNQALAQVLAIAAVTSIDIVRVWSPNKTHREAFSTRLEAKGFTASASETLAAAVLDAEVACTITSAADPFIGPESVKGLSHFNLCGSNNPSHSEMTPGAIAEFQTLVVDDLAQARLEYGDLIRAVESGTAAWENISELKDVVGGRVKPKGRSLFKSGGAALEDVALGSMVYDRAVKRGGFAEMDFGWSRS